MNKILFVILFSVILFSCEEGENFRQEPVSRTLIVYMVADNDVATVCLRWTGSSD